MRNISEKVKRTIYVLAGTIFLVIGAVGVVIPVLPTTPFLLLSAACYMRGSERMHSWMLNNRVFGTFIRDYREGKGIAFRNKLLTLVLLWFTISFSVLFVIEIPLLKGLLFLIAFVVSAHIVLLPTNKQR
jgi:uncharacterized membrane protein YbaN (DUF454 family)